ncbi:elongation factor G-like protein EF-G2 [Marinitenerispora sediminis]|uniref:Elongation factor G-like protein EF-G2 n=1 Tax=Marinitenerispora sediminis TaxID=1931232 RepID=A0A368T3L4_9ACTN|nr:elongation factor G-like protein EF-G2 [Marinitenerispora sediminis]RCV55922.1 elongation factor G-like protein EF-G2 [Marinitenerispora sediminis]RCV57337.1 elongation factor G-like protein EF-G2 [Marinitenerispora sediminis]RCV59425.1 elongation factor G-like protein EF-G2 [Marinitenerispora sediminis]
MAEKSGPAITGRAPAADRPANIRNVVLVGHSGTGKTTLVEALLHAAGSTNRAGRVEDGSTVSDYDEAEIRQRRSINLTVVPVMVDGADPVKVNLLDTPGYADFVGDLRAGLRAADAALFVLSATDGIDERTRMLWEECAALDMPRAVAVTRVDHPRADFLETVRQCQEAFGANVLPAYLPVTAGEGEHRTVRGLMGLLTRRYHDYSTGGPVEAAAPEEVADLVASMRAALIEGVIQESEDETLMDRYMAGEELDPAMLVADLETAVARGTFYPVLAVSTTTGVGVAELLTELPRACPGPQERPVPPVTTPDGAPVPDLSCDPDGPLLAEVVKTVSDPYVGRVSLVRVFSGTLRPDTVVHVSGHGLVDRGHEDHDVAERAGGLAVPLGKETHPVGQVVAGDICAVAKLGRAETGDTLSDPDRPLLMRPWTFPDPLLPVAVRAASKSDEDKLAQAVARLAAEDVTLRVEVNPETHQMVLWCMGEAHQDVALDRLANRYGVNVLTDEMRIPLRETFAVPAQGMGRNVKQSGGHGEYGICRIRVEPLPSGSGLEFVDQIVGGVVPRQYIPSVEKGVRAQMEHGVASGYPLVDIRVTLYDGKAHSVDSSDMAFQKAGRLALRDAAEHARVAMLEPVDELSVLVADAHMGAVMSDLSARRGRVVGSEPVPPGRTLIRAEVPQLEIVRYAIDLRSVSHGTGTFSRRYLRHEPLPEHLAKRHLAEQHG